ncbi:UNVERIFIED_CONTAM: cytochrome [Sesamum calycinum]|uniref:Cytochrome n=1 Tax=Sesamum calycinum TaxID=2727403 RepID=A0AAW2JAG3_9LAMI
MNFVILNLQVREDDYLPTEQTQLEQVNCSSRERTWKENGDFAQLTGANFLCCCISVCLENTELGVVEAKKAGENPQAAGLQGNSYKLFFGDFNEMKTMTKEAKSKPMTFSHEIVPRVSPSILKSVKNYGEQSFLWFGPRPAVIVLDPELIREILSKSYIFQKLGGNGKIVCGAKRYLFGRVEDVCGYLVGGCKCGQPLDRGGMRSPFTGSFGVFGVCVCMGDVGSPDDIL